MSDAISDAYAAADDAEERLEHHRTKGKQEMLDSAMGQPLERYQLPSAEPPRRNAIYDTAFVIKDSGERTKFASGMVRDTQEGKIDYDKIWDGPMADRWAEHLTKGAVKYPDLPDGTPNWMLANSEVELCRFRKSFWRHARQLMKGDRSEDHAAAIFFNINGYEYALEQIEKAKTHSR